MKKPVKQVVICALICAFVGAVMIARDKYALKSQMIRLHVVGASDSVADQTLKLQVRDAVLNTLRGKMDQSQDAEQAKVYLQENLREIEAVANAVLHSAGYSGKACVSLQREAFPVRYYETFKLPSGVYETLRISIGEGKGHNWWCVVFPPICTSAATEESLSEMDFSDSEIKFITQDDAGVVFKFKILVKLFWKIVT